jgi:hypothetical protein
MEKRLQMVDQDVTGIAHHGATRDEYGHDCDGQLRVKLSRTLQDRLAHEAAERGMRLDYWAELKLALDAESRIARSCAAHARRVPRWRTRC